MISRPGRLLIIAFFMLLIGVVLPFLMVIRVLESTLFLNFFSYIISVVGLFLGVIGIALYVGDSKRRDDRHDY